MQENESRLKNNMELLTVNDVASLLKVSKRLVYELANARTRSGEIRDNPIPVLRIGSLVRFKKEDVEGWIEKLVVRGR